MTMAEPDSLKSLEEQVTSSDELTLLIAGVKFTFLHYPFPVMFPLETSGPLPILAAKEILATKAYTIGRRGELKDYIDLYTGMRGGWSSLCDIIALAQTKYGNGFNDRLFLEQLMYLDDVDEAEIVMKTGPVPTKSELIQYFSFLSEKKNSSLDAPYAPPLRYFCPRHLIEDDSFRSSEMFLFATTMEPGRSRSIS
jgi:hypothetical protein